MKIKVCGMRDWGNIQLITELSPDYMGFIHHKDSPRDVTNLKMRFIVQGLPDHIEPVAVFVDTDLDLIKSKIEDCGYTHVQLHGSESPEFCRNIMSDVKIIKTFHIDEAFDFSTLNDYDQVCDYYLFDTSSNKPGGSGKKFNWDLLKNYYGEKPFFLSGGIGEKDVEKIKGLVIPTLYAVDVNSKFESEPAMKEMGMLDGFIKAMRNE